MHAGGDTACAVAAAVAVLVRCIIDARSETEHYERLLAAEGGHTTTQTADWTRRVTTGTPRTWLVIDEVHNYIPQGRAAISKRPLKRLIGEGRNLGLSILVATQQPCGPDGSIQRNAETLIVHPMSMEDIPPQFAAEAGRGDQAVPTRL